MAETGFIRRHSKPLLAVAAILIITGGIFMLSMFSKSKEERRNREYEVSLVKALKNSYEGIEEIRITDPSYSSIPSEAWGANVSISFLDGVSLEHVLAYDKDTKMIRIGIYNEKDQQFETALNLHKGKTTSEVKIIYSDKEEGKQ